MTQLPGHSRPSPSADIGQVCFCTAIIGGLAYRFGNPFESALFLDFVLSLASTASFSIPILQDLAVVPLFILIEAFERGEPIKTRRQRLRWAIRRVRCC